MNLPRQASRSLSLIGTCTNHSSETDICSTKTWLVYFSVSCSHKFYDVWCYGNFVNCCEDDTKTITRLDNVRGWISGGDGGASGSPPFQTGFHRTLIVLSFFPFQTGFHQTLILLLSCSFKLVGLLSASIVSWFAAWSLDHLMSLHWSFCSGSQKKPSNSCPLDSCTHFRQMLLPFLVRLLSSVGLSQCEGVVALQTSSPASVSPGRVGQQRWTDHKAEEIICLGGAPTPQVIQYTRNHPPVNPCLNNSPDLPVQLRRRRSTF